MKRIKILAIGHSYVLRVNRSTIRAVAEDPAFEVTVAAPHFFQGDLRPISCEPEEKDSPLRLVPLRAKWTGKIHVFHYHSRELEHLIQHGGFDGIHAWEEPYIYAGYQIARAAAKSRTPYCFRTAQSLNKVYPPPFNLFERACLRRARYWIAGSPSVYANLLQRGYPRDSGRVITLAVDTDSFQPASLTERNGYKAAIGLRGTVIGFVGRLVEAKGVRILLDALERVDRQLDWSVLFLGSGHLQADIEAWARRLGLNDRVRIHLAKHDEMPRYLSSLDLLAAPSQTMKNWKEQFGRMLIEAFAAGVPVIASDSGEIPGVVGDAGIVLPEKDVAAWARTLEELVRNPEARCRLAQAGRERVDEFSVQRVAARFRQFYRDLAAVN